MIYHEEIEPLAFLYTFSRGKIDVYPLKKDVN